MSSRFLLGLGDSFDVSVLVVVVAGGPTVEVLVVASVSDESVGGGAGRNSLRPSDGV